MEKRKVLRAIPLHRRPKPAVIWSDEEDEPCQVENVPVCECSPEQIVYKKDLETAPPLVEEGNISFSDRVKERLGETLECGQPVSPIATHRVTAVVHRTNGPLGVGCSRKRKISIEDLDRERLEELPECAQHLWHILKLSNSSKLVTMCPIRKDEVRDGPTPKKHMSLTALLPGKRLETP